MPKVDIFNTEKKKVGEIDLADAVFGTEVKEHLFYAAVRYQMAARRAGTHQTKGRTQVSGGGKKPYRQKGTGRARQGTRRAVQFRGGGVVHGPHTRSHAHNLPKKVRRAALKSALSRRTEENALTVFEAFELSEIKTRAFVDVMKKFEFEDLLLVLSEKDETVIKSARNISGVKVLPVEGLNVYDVLDHKNLAMTSAAVDAVVARLEA
ncbi:MAG: 50S ribosomal protein L4 [Myxococcota bacterium]|nr:50S ribosomal protein L4 [Myxococcota bacterium]MEC9389912.1 50S ribosomal protein L4 [Myxococcota bacterium]